jgi:hypothetical protein
MDIAEATRVESSRQSWEDSLGYGEDPFKNALLDLGLSAEAIEDDVTEYRRAMQIFAVPLVAGNKRFHSEDDYELHATAAFRRRMSSFRDSVNKLLGRRRYVIEDSQQFDRVVPLFWLTCPTVSHSKVTYTEMVVDSTKSTWGVKVFGTGMGANHFLSITYRSQFEATGTEPKLIFVTVPMVAYLIAVHQNDVCVGRGLRIEVASERQHDISLGIRTESVDRSVVASNAASLQETTFPLAGDTTHDVHSFGTTLEETDDLCVESGVKAFDLGASSKATISRRNKLDLKFKLPAGRDYVLRRDKRGTGIWWR